MPTYVSLIRFTEQGAKNVRETQRRAAAFRDAAGGRGITVREVYWTLGAYDGLLVLDAPDEETVTAAMVSLGALGNVRTQTMRAFDETEIGGIVERAGATGRSGGGDASGKRGGNRAGRGR